jgi:hypothetical protein
LTNQGDVAVAQGTGTELGTFTTDTIGSSTVQDLINAINADTTVGAKAALVGGTLEITDPQNRSDLAVSTNDTVLGAPTQGAPTAFATPNTVGTQTADLNQLTGNTAGLTTATTLGASQVYSFTAGGKIFSYTSNAAAPTRLAT